MVSANEPTAEERVILGLVEQLRADADTTPLLAMLHRDGPERVRDALTVLAELDPELIVQVALDALIHAHTDGSVAAQQDRKVTRNEP